MFLRRFRKFTKRLNSLVNLVVGVAGFEPVSHCTRLATSLVNHTQKRILS